MNIPLMKYIDEYAGRVICFILSIGKNKTKLNNSPQKVSSILLVKFWGMGSIILTSPAISTIKKQYPDAAIHFLSFGANSGILNLIPGIAKIISVNLKNPITFVLDTLKTITKLRKENYDLVFDFEFYTYYSAILIRLINAKLTAGFNNTINKRSRLFNETVLFNERIHTRDNFLALVTAGSGDSETGLNNTGLASTLTVHDSNMNLGMNDLPLIVVNPNASKMALERRLPAEYFVKIIMALSAASEYQIVLTGSADEKDYVSGIFEKLEHKSNICDLSGKLSVKELVSLVSRSVCLITNDSGPLHIASALNKPVIAFFGPESPLRYGPLSTRHLVFYRSLECSPCMSVSNSKTVNCIYPKPLCMTGFDINDIIHKTKKFLADRHFTIEKENVHHLDEAK